MDPNRSTHRDAICPQNCASIRPSVRSSIRLCVHPSIRPCSYPSICPLLSPYSLSLCPTPCCSSMFSASSFTSCSAPFYLLGLPNLRHCTRGKPALPLSLQPSVNLMLSSLAILVAYSPLPLKQKCLPYQSKTILRINRYQDVRARCYS